MNHAPDCTRLTHQGTVTTEHPERPCSCGIERNGRLLESLDNQANRLEATARDLTPVPSAPASQKALFVTLQSYLRNEAELLRHHVKALRRANGPATMEFPRMHGQQCCERDTNFDGDCDRHPRRRD